MASTIGLKASAVCWRSFEIMSGDTALALGHVTVQRVTDLDPFAIPIGVLFPDATVEQLTVARALAGQHFDFATGEVLLAIQSHLVRFAGKTILIDSCVGEDKARPLRPEWNLRTGTRYLANLAACGFAPEDIDIVMCTHLHADHVGWNTRLRSGRWVPTFPNARYLMSQREVHYRAHEAAQSAAADHGSYQDSIAPIFEVGLARFVRNGDEIVDGGRIVDLAGHAPGQVGLELASDAHSRVLFCGDAIHSPLQVFHPQWSSGFCFDRAHAERTRLALLQRAAGESLYLIPAHLRAATMRIEHNNGGFVPLIET
jgi:glyoxylase-like metal-dependent hydrolase (beta-lactamase superfamily II)